MYSNYSREEEDVVDIIKALIVYSGMKVDPKTFDKVKTGVKLHYIAGVNDTCATAVDYLLSKLYYYQTRVDHLYFMNYDEHKNMFEMFDSLDDKTWYSQYVIPVTFYKN